MRKRIQPYLCAGMTVALLSATAHADATSRDDMAMYGFDREAGELVRHDFAASQTSAGLAVRTAAGMRLQGIDGAAYVPGHQNIFAFWTSPDENKGKFVYVDVHTAEAVVMNDHVEGGRVTGAVAVHMNDDNWQVFAVQRAEVAPPRAIAGQVNINPNNSHHMKFDLVEVKENGQEVHWTRQDLLDARGDDLDADGNLIKGTARSFRIRPKGGGGQQGLTFDGEPATLQNDNTYTFTSGNDSPMQVRVFNTKMQGNGNSNSMGHWYLEVLGGTAYQGETAEVLTDRRLVRVNHKNDVYVDAQSQHHAMPAGTVTELFTLGRDYDGLASNDGQTFYATSGDQLYVIDAVAETETIVNAMSVKDVFGLEFYGDELLSFEIEHDRFVALDADDAQALETPRSIGMRKLGAIVFVPKAADPLVQRARLVGYD
ncbi:MAG: hypothetical protein WD118_04300 [Phycisphaeraceae bacterium]